MNFPDYVWILQKNAKKRIGEKKLCDILFEPVIKYAELTDNEKRPPEIPKESISRMMKGTYPIHQFIRDHIYDASVCEQLIIYFQKIIVPMLVDDGDDIFYQLMQHVELEEISPAHKASIRLLANRESLAVFLVDVFILAVSTNSNAGDKQNKTNPCAQNAQFSIRGIDSNKTINVPKIKVLTDKIGFTHNDIITAIEKLIEEAASIQVIHVEKSQRRDIFSFKQPYEYEYYKMKCIRDYCSKMDIELNENFFDTGDLYESLNLNINPIGQNSKIIQGSKESKKKLEALDEVYLTITEFESISPFLSTFSELFYLELAMENTGNIFDEDVRVVLQFPLDSVVTPDTVIGFKKSVVDYFVYKDDSIMQIERGVDYLSFYEEKAWFSPKNINSSFNVASGATFEDVQNVMRYYFASTKNTDNVEIKFDVINQHTSVAFPCPILLKTNDIQEVAYSIRSKQSPDILFGKLNISR